MKHRTKPKEFLHSTIMFNGQDVGYIQLVEYTPEGGKPHIEFHIDEAYRGAGMMKVQLPKYLERCKEYGHTQLIAVVKHDNAPSIRLLQNNGFVRIPDVGDNQCYIVDLSLSPWVVQGIIEKIQFLTQKEKE